MLRKFASLAFISLLCVSSIDAAELPSGVIQKRQPNWVARTLSQYADGQPKAMLFYAPIPDSHQDAPIQLVTFHNSGVVHEEVELTVVPEKHPSALKFETTVVPHGHTATYYPNSSIAAITTYHQGQLQGPYQTYHPNGQTKAWVTYDKGVLKGEFKEFFPNGVIASEGTYKNGARDGSYTENYPKGTKSLAMTYENGVVEGEILEWYESEGVKSRRIFKKGLLTDSGDIPALTHYNEKHRIIETQNFRHGQASGLHVKFHDNGQESYRQYYRDGLKVGKEVFTNADGSIAGQGEYVQGVPVGEHFRKDPTTGKVIFSAKYDRQGNLLQPITENYPDGAKKAQYSLQNGVFAGERIEYYPDGQISNRYHYSKGEFDGVQQDYFPDGKLKKQAIYSNGKREGLYEEWNNEGTRIYSIAFKNGQRHGPSQEWHDNGKPKLAVNFEDGLENGEKLAWNDKGVMLLSAMYRQGKPQGLWQEWYPSEKLQRRTTFANGELDGVDEVFYDSDQMQRQSGYENGVLSGAWLQWYEDGSPETEGKYVSGLRQGPWKSYFPLLPGQEQPQLSRSLNYLDGEYSGDQRTFYFDGSTQAILRYENGILHGTKELWARNGEILQQTDYRKGQAQGKHYEKKPTGEVIIATYNNNRLEGPYQIFYPSNKYGERIKSLEADYLNGHYEGEVSAFDENGNKIGSTLYRAGKKNGPSAVFSPEGATIFVATFVNDIKEGPLFEYYPSGAIKREVSYVNDRMDGEEKIFYEDGKPQSINTYSKGILNGPSRSWTPEGVLTFEGHYRDNKRNGKFNKFYDDGSPKVLQVYVDDQLKPGSKRSYGPDGVIIEKAVENL